MTEYKAFDYHSKSHGYGFIDFIEGFDRSGLYIEINQESLLPWEKGDRLRWMRSNNDTIQ